ncbi:MAG: hypothetical protein HQ518_32320 [Rhodopirellula sp.]|nr:hypothetical protein [Rhodopirellula sp.]
MTESKKPLSDFEDFLADTDDESKEDAVAGLQANKVNVRQFFSRVQQTVQEGYRQRLQELAASQQKAESGPGFLTDLAQMSRDAMLACFDRVRRGEFGAEYKEAALARCRNKDVSELTDEDLRSWLEDVGEILGEPEE